MNRPDSCSLFFFPFPVVESVMMNFNANNEKLLFDSFGSLHDSEYEQSPNHATPSHLSIGTSSLNTWTEGTPSYTESTMSGSLGRASADHPG